MKLFDHMVLTASAIALCSQLGVTPCTEDDLTWKWLHDGGMCGQHSCNFSEGCPNERANSCEVNDPKYECVNIYDYPTIGSLEKFEQDDTLDGLGGKSYLCRPRGAPIS